MKANEAAAGRARPAPSRARRFLHNVTHYRYLHLMVLPGLAFFLLFKYVPMYGIIIAFKNYKGAAGGFSAIMSAPWIGLKNFEIFFNSLYCERVFKNTIYLSLLRLIFSFPAPILLALMINEIRANWFKRTVQTITYMPYFLSWVVVAGLLNTLLSPDNGAINALIKMAGGQPVYFLTSKQWFRPILIISEIWKNIGYCMLIYLSGMQSIDDSLYEAATVDGASGWTQLWRITLPMVRPVVFFVLITTTVDAFKTFEQVQIMTRGDPLYATTTLVHQIYLRGFTEFKMGYASAMAVVLLAIISLVTALSWGLNRGGERG